MNIEEAIKVLNNFNPVDCGREDTQAIETLLTAYEKEKEKNKKIENELEKHIKFCEQEAEGSLNNGICHISLKFNKRLLDIINEENKTMLSNEEKKAIEYLKIEYEKLMKEDNILFPLYKSDAKRLIDIIEKQSKEIEELKNKIMEKELLIDGMKEDKRIAVEEIQEQYFISKDKIKEILEIEEKIDNEKLLSLLQTIVDENARLEDIEDRKVQIEYNNVFNKGVKSVEDKIKAKIEEYDDKEMTVNLVNRSAGKTFQQAVRNEVRKVLQSLLEKE